MNFKDMIYLAISYHLVKKKSKHFVFKIGYFSISLYRAFFLKEINTVSIWPLPSSPLNLVNVLHSPNIEVKDVS